MFTWGKGVAVRGAILSGAMLLVAAAAWLVNSSLGRESEAASAAGAKASPLRAKLTPSIEAKSEPETVDARTDTKPADTATTTASPITLHAAIALVEGAGKGEVVKGERSGDESAVKFNLEVIGPKGERLRLVVHAAEIAADSAADARTFAEGTKLGAGKPVTASAAAKLVENTGKGEVVKVEKGGTGKDTQFSLEAADPRGVRTRYFVNGLGAAIIAAPFETRGPGVVKAVDAAKGVITITVGTKTKKDATYIVGKHVKITIDGKDIRLAELKVGAVISLVLDAGSTVTQIRTAVPGRREGKGG